MNPRLTRRPEWDGTYSLLMDSEVILERKSLAEVKAKEEYLDMWLTVTSIVVKGNQK